MKKIVVGVLASLSIVLLAPAVAMAHVVVTPKQVGVGQRQVFSVSVPNEKDVPVINIMVRVPAGVTDVTPTVKSGWTIDTTKSGSEVNSIVWSGGTIPGGQRDDFTFSAQAPAKATELNWLAYQTYANGVVVNWDQKPTDNHSEAEDKGPYSVTSVTNDLATTDEHGMTETKSGGNNNATALVLSIIALVVGIGSILLRQK